MRIRFKRKNKKTNKSNNRKFNTNKKCLYKQSTFNLDRPNLIFLWVFPRDLQKSMKTPSLLPQDKLFYVYRDKFPFNIMRGKE